MNQQVDNIIEHLGIVLTPMQEAAYHSIAHSRKDLVILSPTGSGKTWSYQLPLVELLDAQIDEVQAIVIVPGRELALQSTSVFKDLKSPLRVMACYGGRTTMDEHRGLRKLKPQLVIGTPGRLNDHLSKNNFSTNHIGLVIIDEFDKCLDMGFHDEMTALLEHLPQGVRKILLSATREEDMREQHILNKHFDTLDFLDEQISERVSVSVVHSPTKDKLDTLYRLLLQLGSESSIVFLNYRDAVARTNDYLKEKGFVTSAFHGGLDQQQREDALYRFATASANVLVSTDLGSRGLDIEHVANIIHYHIPETEDNYIHRVGRTARWDRKGQTFFILGPEEHIPDYVEADVKEYILQTTTDMFPSQPRMMTIYIGKGKKDKLSKGDVLGFLCKKGGLEATDIGQIDVRDRYCYVAVNRCKACKLLERVQGEKIKGLKTIMEKVE